MVSRRCRRRIPPSIRADSACTVVNLSSKKEISHPVAALTAVPSSLALTAAGPSSPDKDVGNPMTTVCTSYSSQRSRIAAIASHCFRSITTCGCAMIPMGSDKATPMRLSPGSRPRTRVRIRLPATRFWRHRELPQAQLRPRRPWGHPLAPALDLGSLHHQQPGQRCPLSRLPIHRLLPDLR